jgi:hypothetical protein
MRYDGAGNLTWDGKYIYRYDAWNRLIQVDRGRLENGQVIADKFIRAYVYDAFGRLARSYGPYPDPESSNGQLRTERYYYDGARRIQEVVVDPAANLDLALMANAGTPQGAELLAAATQAASTSGSTGITVDTELLPTAVEEVQVTQAPTGHEWVNQRHRFRSKFHD